MTARAAFRLVGLVALVGLLGAPSGASAGQDDPRLPQPVEPPPFPVMPKSPPPDFFFSRPRASVAVRGGVTFARAGSNWYDFVTEQLTLDSSDFRSYAVGGELGITLRPRLDLVFGGDYAVLSADSEFRDWVDNNRLPIEQTTKLRQSALTVGGRYAFFDRGRQLGSLAWVPRRFVPYAGGGVGMLWYEMKQTGDFVDFRTLNVFGNNFRSSGWGSAFYVNGGVDMHWIQHAYLSFDARYLWADATLDQPWRSFDPLDLTGLRVTGGISAFF